jgi:site-specific DNA-methyltransferase (adenine-specific)
MSVWAIHEGDCIDVMRTLAPESIDAVITSPPYAMQRKTTYGGVPEADYPEWTVAWMREVRRVLKPDGNVVINIRPHKADGVLADYVLRSRLALREDGWAELDELIWHKPDAMPTAPANRPRRAWEHLLWFGKHGRAWADPFAAGEPYRDQGPGRRGFTRGDVARRNGWDHAFGVGSAPLREIARVTNLLTLPKAKRSGFDHPAPYPPALAEWIAHLTCPPGGTILDPFNGSGSTGVAAIRGGWSYVGIDTVPEYAAMSRARLEATDSGAA